MSLLRCCWYHILVGTHRKEDPSGGQGQRELVLIQPLVVSRAPLFWVEDVMVPDCMVNSVMKTSSMPRSRGCIVNASEEQGQGGAPVRSLIKDGDEEDSVGCRLVNPACFLSLG